MTPNKEVAIDTRNIKIIRSGRKTIALEITQDAEIIVRAPYHFTDRAISNFVRSKSDWIRKHLSKMEKLAADRAALEPLTKGDIEKLAEDALRYIPLRVREIAKKMGVTFGNITIRNQKTRWGSCSAKGNLNFNCLLMLTPPEVVDYVIIHELCHRIHMNHSPAFWREVEKYDPGYRDKKKWMKEHGRVLFDRMAAGSH